MRARGELYGDAWRRMPIRKGVAVGSVGHQPRTGAVLRRFVVVPVLMMVAAVVVAACGSSNSSSASTSSHASDARSTAANIAAAEAGVAQFTGHPSAFPVTEPLSKPLPAGAKFVYLESSDPIGAELGALLQPAVKSIGAKYIVISAGETASSAQAAASSALADKPSVVFVPAFPPSDFGNKLHALSAEGAKIVGTAQVGWAQYGIDWCTGCAAQMALSGKLLADWVVATKGAKANAAFYSVPEFAFTAQMYSAFKAQMTYLCPSCTIRNVPVDVSTIGSTAPKTMVNDLQAHSNTNVAVFSTMDMAQGMPAAMKAAGVNVATSGNAPTPENLDDIKAGKLDAGVASDFAVLTWTLVDVGARLVIGQTPQASEVFAPTQLLTQKDITFDTQYGYSAYPDFAKRFIALWHPKG